MFPRRQVLLLNVSFRMPAEPSTATGDLGAWQLQLRSRGEFLEASETWRFRDLEDRSTNGER